jgi:hypothetical protein
VVEIARRVGLHPSTAHRLLAALIDGGYAAQDPTTGRYRLGGKALELASGARDAGRPPIVDAHPQILRSAQDKSAKTVAPDDPFAVDGDRVGSRSAPPAGMPATSRRAFEAILDVRLGG